MKRVIGLLFFLLIATLVFAGCGGETAVTEPPLVEDPVVVVEEQAEPETAVVEQSEPTAEAVVEEPTEVATEPPAEEVVEVATEVPVEEEVADTAVAEPMVEHDPTDLTLIGATGRPQFLNAYASW